MTRKELIDMYSTREMLTKKEADRQVKAVMDALSDALAVEDRIHIPGLGTFKAAYRTERQGRNPRTGEALVIPAKRVVTFKPSREIVS